MRDPLFFNAPCVLLLNVTHYPLDAGLAAQNIELAANALGLGVLYDSCIEWIANSDPAILEWIGMPEGVAAAILLGRPAVHYERSAPRKPATLIER